MDLNGVQGIEANLLDHHSLHEAAEGTDTIYSMASPMPGADLDFERVNSEGIANLLEVAQEMGVKSLVHLSTLEVHGFGAGTVSLQSPINPAGPYQSSKASAESTLMQFARSNALPRVVIVRAARAVGPRDWTLAVPLLRMLASGKAVVPRGGAMSFSHPKDIAQVMYRAASNPAVAGGAYLVKSFDATPSDLVAGLASATGAHAEVRASGRFSKPDLPEYTRQELEAGLSIGTQENWRDLSYAPAYDLGRTCQEIAAWYRKEPWVVDPA